MDLRWHREGLVHSIEGRCCGLRRNIDPFIGGIYPIADGIRLIADGIRLIADGIHLIADGIHPIADGIHPIVDGIHLIADGIHPIADGIHLIADGIDGQQLALDAGSEGNRGLTLDAGRPTVPRRNGAVTIPDQMSTIKPVVAASPSSKSEPGAEPGTGATATPDAPTHTRPSWEEIASWIIVGGALLYILFRHLVPLVVAGLALYLILDRLAQAFSRRIHGAAAKPLALVLVTLILGGGVIGGGAPVLLVSAPQRRTQ